jgi:hypothetical protein
MLNTVYIGIGQCGNRFVDCFAKGISENDRQGSVAGTAVLAVNTAKRDMSVLKNIPESNRITITLEGNSDQPRQVNIVNATGKTVKRIVVPAGQRRIQVNAGELSPGLNIVNVNGQKTQACKIIVR